jgi:hypothetical protein
MCHHLEWERWELLRDEERRADEEPRAVEVVVEEPTEAEPERDPERELVRV